MQVFIFVYFIWTQPEASPWILAQMLDFFLNFDDSSFHLLTPDPLTFPLRPCSESARFHHRAESQWQIHWSWTKCGCQAP